MDSPNPVSRYVAQNSKKRVFPAGSSSVGFKEVEVLEVPPPMNLSSKSKRKEKKVICHEIIDLDNDEDCGSIDGDVYRSGKGKEALSHFSAGLSKFASDGSGNDIHMSKNGTVEDFKTNLLNGEVDWMDRYYDDIMYDDFADLQPQMDISSGVEVPFAWLPNCPGNNAKVPTTRTSTSTSSSSQFELNGVSISHNLQSSDPSSPLKPFHFKDLTSLVSSHFGGTQAASQNLNGKRSSNWPEVGPCLKKFTTSSSKASPGDDPSLSLRKSKRTRVHYSAHKHFLSGASLHGAVNNHSTPGVGTFMPVMMDPSMGSVVSGSVFAPLVQDSAYNQNGASSVGLQKRNVDEVLQNFDLFKKFDTVEDYSDHHYSKSGSCAKQPPKNWAKRIQEEWKILEKDLPDTISVRVYESRMDLLRAVIVGAEGTPYHDGLFFFDVFFPSSYPNVPPKVHYHSGGLRINPNLYNCGKVCLSLLNTWGGSHKEKWVPCISTMLQVLVSIQGLILNAKPYFNEPGYAHSMGSKSGEEKSLEYNESTFMLSLQTMVYNMRRPPKYFEAYVVGHFVKRAREIMVCCKAYLEGAQVGCLVKGGVQDIDEGDKSCSQHFRTNLAAFITTLVNTFSQIGANNCQEFLSLSSKPNGRRN